MKWFGPQFYVSIFFRLIKPFFFNDLMEFLLPQNYLSKFSSFKIICYIKLLLPPTVLQVVDASRQKNVNLADICSQVFMSGGNKGENKYPSESVVCGYSIPFVLTKDDLIWDMCHGTLLGISFLLHRNSIGNDGQILI